ncbi:DUF3618 domain-containing protein, partial [Streptomyces sp. NPDC054956]
MTKTRSHGSTSLPTAQELRRQFARTRTELGRTVEALSSKAGVSGRAHDGMAGVKGQVGRVTARLRDSAAHVRRLAADKDLGSVRGKVRGKAVRAAAA